MVEPTRRTHQSHGRLVFTGDDRGQLLILTGVLLVLGFVIIGTTIVQLRSLEESTARVQRDALLETASGLIDNFNRTIRDSVELGETNITDFQLRTEQAESRLRDTATRSGLYVSLELDSDVDRSVYWRDSRCGGYATAFTTGGVVVGHDKDTQRETIAGAAYAVHITDGRQSIEMDYYVKIVECMPTLFRSFVEDSNSTTGNIEKPTWSHSNADGRASMWVNESLSGQVFDYHWATIDVLETSSFGWALDTAISSEDDVYATHTTPVTADFLDFKIEVPAGMASPQVANDFEISVHAKHTPGLTNDDILILKGEYGGNEPAHLTFTIPVTDTEQNFTFQPNSPSGNQHWEVAEMKQTTWTLMVQEENGQDALRVFEVDYVVANVTTEVPLGYQVDSYFEFPTIPNAYNQHEVNLTYRLTPGTSPDETFHFEVYNSQTGLFEKLADLQNTNGGFVELGPFTLTDAQENDNAPWFRIVDPLDTDDDQANDKDLIEIDYFELVSRVTA